MARVAEGEVALLCDAISDYLKFGRDCQQGKRGSYAAAESSQCKQLDVIPAGLTCAAQGCWKNTCQ